MDYVLFTLWGYDMTYMEMTALLSGLLAVYLAVKNNVLTWPIGLLNVTLSGIIFFHIQLYADMFLQMYFFLSGLYGWYAWSKGMHETPIKVLSKSTKIRLAALVLVLTFVVGFVVSNLHEYFPSFFTKKASYAYLDTMLALLSILANTLLALRYFENWILWIVIDVISVALYFQKGVKLIALEFMVFLILAVMGHLEWQKEIKTNSNQKPLIV